ncbi:microsomal dipeptidase precursor [Fusarium beomiforme]|uniref:Dipeptidase n=1 Tax=Fusarium beomiforme TaxID=44412 RepID=A0A9P5DV22_9HYPO|nr:microsomal dipeptidase precursor [Fusarium beomiforme]
MQGTDTVWYFAYGSNMASTTLKRRQLNPRESRPVFVSSHILCFDVFGVPYKEPAMAGIRERTRADSPKSTPPVHGMAYLLSREEYHRLIVSEGAGVAYVETELIARSSNGVAGRPATEEIPVWTLMARFPFRPEALPSVRYMGLLIQGAEECGLPASYQDYLRDLPAYHKHLSKYEEFGASLLIGFWMPILIGMMKRVKKRTDSAGNAEPWVGEFVRLVFIIMWLYYDTIHSWIWGRNGGRNLVDNSGAPLSRCSNTPSFHLTVPVLIFSSPKTNDALGKLECLLKTLQQIDTIHLLIERYPDIFGAVKSSNDIERIFRSGRIASLIGVEGLHQIAESASVVRLFHKLGVRYITLCHDYDNRYADSAKTGKNTNGGLSSHGLGMIREMNRTGMWVVLSYVVDNAVNFQSPRIIDLSHTATDTQKQVLKVSQAPIIFSHSSCPRNVTDEVLGLLKINKGIIMICFLPNLTSVSGVKDASIDQVVDHVLYAGQKIGFEHVGIGSDFDGMLEGPRDLDDMSRYPQLVAKLLERGLSEDTIAQVLGGNIIRILSGVEAVAKELQCQVPVLSDEIEEVWTPEQKDILTRMGALRKSRGSCIS